MPARLAIRACRPRRCWLDAPPVVVRRRPPGPGREPCEVMSRRLRVTPYARDRGCMQTFWLPEDECSRISRSAPGSAGFRLAARPDARLQRGGDQPAFGDECHDRSVVERDSSKAYLAFEIERGSLAASRRLLEIVMAADAQQTRKSRALAGRIPRQPSRPWRRSSRLYTEADKQIFAVEGDAGILCRIPGQGDQAVRRQQARRRAGRAHEGDAAARGLAAVRGRQFAQQQKQLLDRSGDDAKGVHGTASKLTLGIALLGLVLGILATIVITRSVTRPVAHAGRVAQDLARGDLAGGASAVPRRDGRAHGRAAGHGAPALDHRATDPGCEPGRRHGVGGDRPGQRGPRLADRAAGECARGDGSFTEEMTATVAQNADTAKNASTLAAQASAVALRAAAWSAKWCGPWPTSRSLPGRSRTSSA